MFDFQRAYHLTLGPTTFISRLQSSGPSITTLSRKIQYHPTFQNRSIIRSTNPNLTYGLIKGPLPTFRVSVTAPGRARDLQFQRSLELLRQGCAVATRRTFLRASATDAGGTGHVPSMSCLLFITTLTIRCCGLLVFQKNLVYFILCYSYVILFMLLYVLLVVLFFVYCILFIILCDIYIYRYIWYKYFFLLQIVELYDIIDAWWVYLCFFLKQQEQALFFHVSRSRVC